MFNKIWSTLLSSSAVDVVDCDCDSRDTELEVHYRKGVYVLKIVDQFSVMDSTVYRTWRKFRDVRRYGQLHQCHDLGTNCND